jgi:hypothetical protein
MHQLAHALLCPALHGQLTLRKWLLVICFWSLAVTGPSASTSGQGAGTAPTGAIVFDIPSQSLGDALYAYSALTGVEILTDDALLSRRRSAGIKGSFTVETALQHLLAHSGLTARYVGVGAGAFTLTQIPAPPAGVSSDDDSSLEDRYDAYSMMLQSAVVQALCRYDETRPGYYRVAVRLWISPSGLIERAAFLGSTGDGHRDAALLRLFDHMDVGDPPPDGLPQPATLLVMPLSPRETGDCVSVQKASAAP